MVVWQNGYAAVCKTVGETLMPVQIRSLPRNCIIPMPGSPSLVRRGAHNAVIVGSNPTPGTLVEQEFGEVAPQPHW